MNTTPTNPEAPDELDRLLADFFKAQLKKPWPNAPFPAATAAASEPSELVTARSGGAAPGAPAQPTKRGDSTARARFTLAASVAVLLGAGMFLSNSFQPDARETNTPTQNDGGMLQKGGADGSRHAPLKAIEEDKAKNNGNTGTKPIDLNKAGE
jgi:hypothetical protein